MGAALVPEPMAVSTYPAAHVEASQPVLPRIYITILVGEVAVLATLVAMFRRHPPLAYELGWAGVVSMMVMQLYSVRRRVRALRNLGSLRAWLDAHIFLGLQGFVFVAYHSVGITMSANLAAVNFALVSLVVITGIAGRYLYSFIPRTRMGHVIAADEVDTSLGKTALPPELRRPCRGLVDLVTLDLARRRVLRELERDPSVTRAHARAVRRAITLASRISALDVADRWFSRWTLVHRPLAILLLGITTLHVLAHFAYAT